MKKANLIVAIIYTVILGLIAFKALEESDGQMFLGVLILSVPVIINWITWSKLGKIELS